MADAFPVDLDRAAALAPGDPTTLVELLFFAYRDFTGEADALLEAYGLGRAHHRVLHFVCRHPGLRVTELLGILKITKQSLARVLTHLVDEQWIESRKDPDDQRARLLILTDKGRDLTLQLADLQKTRVRNALAQAASSRGSETVGGGSGIGGCGSGAIENEVRRFLFAMIAAEDRPRVEALLGAGRAARE